jgi:hypothetical protein
MIVGLLNGPVRLDQNYAVERLCLFVNVSDVTNGQLSYIGRHSRVLRALCRGDFDVVDIDETLQSESFPATPGGREGGSL